MRMVRPITLGLFLAAIGFVGIIGTMPSTPPRTATPNYHVWTRADGRQFEGEYGGKAGDKLRFDAWQQRIELRPDELSQRDRDFLCDP
jgi:hypothetical protein